MQPNEFVLWLKGFAEACHEYQPTPKQWDILREKLAEVDDKKFVETPGMFQVHPQPPYPGINLGPNGTGTPNMHDLVDRYPWGSLTVWGGAGTAGPPIDCLTRSTTGYIAPVSQSIPPTTLTTGSSSTGTVTYYPAYTNISYTVTTGSGVGFGTITTTPNTTGYVTVGNPEAMIGFSNINTTSTVFNPQSGSWHYTNQELLLDSKLPKKKKKNKSVEEDYDLGGSE